MGYFSVLKINELPSHEKDTQDMKKTFRKLKLTLLMKGDTNERNLPFH